MTFHRGDSRFSTLSAGVPPAGVSGGRWLLLLFVAAAAACGQDGTPSDQAPPGDLVRMAACQRGIEDFCGRENDCPSPSEAREQLRQLSVKSFYDYPCRGRDDAPRLYLSESDGVGSVSLVFDTATGQLVGARQSSDAEEFCEQSSRSIRYGEDPLDCAFYPGQSCPEFDPLRGSTDIICVLSEP
jgi:hypothetical protein